MLRGPQDMTDRRQVTVMFSDMVGSTALSSSIALPSGVPSGCAEVDFCLVRCLLLLALR
jgi:class 3 adenylate cyclase